jgi:protein-L-isoaspartate(D-aspartate) O-methyltransferase
MLVDSYKHKGMRKNLVEVLSQKGISDKAVLEAINKVPRHFFLENAFEAHAYEDKAFPIGNGQTISQPFTVAFQTQCLQIKKNDKVLEIGTGSGYQTSILLELGADVYSIEYVKELYDKTKYFLNFLGYKTTLYNGDGTLGLPKHAPYDKIIVTAGAPTVPDALIEQLKINGILIIPVGDREKQSMIKLTKISENQLVKETYDNFSFVPLVGKNGW